MKFLVEKEVFEKLPNACFGAVMARGADNGAVSGERKKLQKNAG